MHDAKVQDEAFDLVGGEAIGEGSLAQGFSPAFAAFNPEVANEGDGSGSISHVVDPWKEQQQELHGLLLFRLAALRSIWHRYVWPFPGHDHPVVAVRWVHMFPLGPHVPLGPSNATLRPRPL